MEKIKAGAYPVVVSLKELGNGYKNSQAEYTENKGIEIIIINNGKLLVYTDKKNVTLKAGEGLIINSGIGHKIRSINGERCVFYSLYFEPSFLYDDYLYEKYGQILGEGEKFSLIGLKDDNLRDEALLDCFNRVISANLIKKPGYEIVTKALLLKAWASFYESLCKEENSSENFKGRKALSQDRKRVIAGSDYIKEHFAEIVTLSDIAKYLHVSESECCRCFKREILRSPIEYLMEYRIFEAVRIIYKMPGSFDSVRELGIKTGFNSPSYFNRIFKKYTGFTPLEIKKMIISDINAFEKIYDMISEEVNI